jgi:hypothetical protein
MLRAAPLRAPPPHRRGAGSVTSAGASRFVTFAVDEILSINWFGELLPPYWRRALPVGNTSVVPVDMLTEVRRCPLPCDRGANATQLPRSQLPPSFAAGTCVVASCCWRGAAACCSVVGGVAACSVVLP